MPDPVNYEDFANWPADSDLEVRRSLMRLFFGKVIARSKALLEDWSDRAGQVIVVNAAATGPTAAGAAGVEAVLFGNLGVRQFKAGAVPLTGSADLTDADHGGASIEMTNGSAASLTVNLDSEPATGASDGFQCEVMRAIGAAVVTIVAGSGLTLRNPDGHTGIVEGGVARLRVKGSDLYLWGYTQS